MKTGKKYPFLFLLPYLLVFTVFIILPICVAVVLSFTDFNTVQMPNFVGFNNYINLATQDSIFMQYVLPNTVTFALIVGPGGYCLSFLLAWAIAQLTRVPRTILALIFYSPSLTTGVAMNVLWKIIFSGDATGYLNAICINLGILNEPRTWLISDLLPIMIIIGLWSSAGVGFLAMLAGIMNADEELYEAGAIDGIKNRFQQMIYITIPTMKAQMLFGAVMAITQSFGVADVTMALCGYPSTDYAARTVVTHLVDYGTTRFEMGYASAIATVLFVVMILCNKAIQALLSKVGT